MLKAFKEKKIPISSEITNAIINRSNGDRLHLNNEITIKEAIVIEDTPGGILAAKSCGIECIGITNTFKRDKLQLADQVFSNYNDIHKYLLSSKQTP